MKRLLLRLFCLFLVTSLIPIFYANASPVHSITQQNPVILAKLGIPSPGYYPTFRGVTLVGDYAYIASRDSSELFVFHLGDISTEAQPPEIYPIYTLTMNGSGTCIARKGDILYIGGMNSVNIVDVSIPDCPSLIETLNIDCYNSIKVQNNYLLTIGLHEVSKIYDITNPREPNFLSNFGSLHWSYCSNVDAIISQDKLYAVERSANNVRDSGIAIYDISNMNNVTELDFISIPFSPYHIEIANEIIYIAGEGRDESNYLKGYVSSWSLANITYPSTLDCIEIYGARAFGINQEFCITESDLIDITSPDNLVRIGGGGGSYTGDGFPYDISIEGDKILCGGSDFALLSQLNIPSVPEWRKDIQPGDLLLSRSRNWIFPLGGIDFWTHVGIYIGNGEVVEAFPPIVNITDITSWDYPNRTCVELLRVTGADDNVTRRVVRFALDHVADFYEIPDGVKDPDPDSEWWYCSELAWAAYINQGIDIEYTRDDWVVSPQEINDDEDTYEVNNHMEEIPIFRGLTFGLFSPADFILTDPDGLSISKELNEIPGAAYIIDDFDGDGDPDDILGIPDRKIGDYHITVLPDEDALPNDTYTLVVLANDETIVLAENVQISDIPDQGYIVTSGETGVTAWNYLFEDTMRGTKLYLNTSDQTFQFITPDKEFPIREASKMRVIDLSRGKFARYNWFGRHWWIDTQGLDLDSELKAHVAGCRFKDRPEELIIIHHQDEELWLSAVAMDENTDFCSAHAVDIETGKHYLLLDRRGVEPTGTTAEEPTVDFTASRTEGRVPLFVRFTDESTGEITNWQWDFGDGSTSTRQNPSHVYRRPGNYTVALTVSWPGGSDTIVMNEYIQVEPLRHWR